MPLLSEGLWFSLALVVLYTAVMIMWLSTDRSHLPRPHSPAYFRHCDGCLSEVRASARRCPRCGALTQADAEQLL